jgi:hypothetical protein
MSSLDKFTDAKRRPAMFAVIGLCTALLVVWVIWMSTALLEQSRANEQIAKDSRYFASAILDCTDPAGECFKRSEERYATAVSGINAGTLRIIAAALSCQADGITEQDELAECTTTRADRSAREASPQQ